MRTHLITLLTLFSVFFTFTASADQGYWGYDTGSFYGTVFQNSMELTGDDGLARSGLLRVRDSRFGYLEVNIDTGVVGACNDGSPLLFAEGEAVLTNYSGSDALFMVFDPTPFCATPPEVVTAFIVGGRGVFAGASGDVELTLPDDTVLRWSSEPIMTPLGMLPYPQVVYAHNGSFVVNLD